MKLKVCEDDLLKLARPLHFLSHTREVARTHNLQKVAKRGATKTVVDPFSKKDKHDMKAPAMLNIRNTGKH